MTTGEGLLRRWSRRKQAAQATPPTLPSADPAAVVAPPEPPDLPSIETLGLSSDYTAFLQNGVSAEVQRLALQRAWQSDERIAGFRGMAEYAWDFNAPGYGRLSATDDVAKLLDAVLTPPEDPPETAEPVAPAAPHGPALAEPALPPGLGQAEEAQGESTAGLAAGDAPAQQVAGTRRHGSALPS